MEFTIMSLNLKNNYARKNSRKHWKNRLPAICELIKQEKPDIIGTQECRKEMLEELKKNYQPILS